MRLSALAVLLSAALAAPPAAADMAELEALRDGSLKKLMFSEPKPVTEVGFTDLDGGSHSLADYDGQIVLLNFWATWCAPCRKEMPALDALQAELGGADFQVVTVATGRNSPAGLTRFFADEAIENLPLFTDPKQELARNMAVLGLPVTVLIDRQGNEIARLMGDADWNSDSARAIIAALIAAAPPADIEG
jgi:thiol-disulfide isomerase/thioredoxin